MNLNLFIAKKLSKKNINTSDKPISRMSNSIACASISISVLVMLVAIIVASGFKKEILEKASGFSGDFVMTYPGAEPSTEKYLINRNFSYADKILSLRGLKSFSGVCYKPGMIKTEENVQGLVFKGVDSLYNMDFYSKYLVEGVLPNFSVPEISSEILVSKSLSNILKLNVGDYITAYFVNQNVRLRKFKIVGLYNANLEEIDNTLVLVDLRQIQKLIGVNENQVSAMEVHLDNNISDSQRRNILESLDYMVMDDAIDSDSNVIVNSVREMYHQLFDWLELIDYNVLMILVLMILVAGFNMISCLLIILFEKISMIGVLKAMGMRSFDVVKIFIYRGMGIVYKGLIIGNGLALIFYWIQNYTHLLKLNPENYFVDHVPVDFTFGTFLVFNFAVFVLMILVMLIPSAFISKISPDKTIRMN